MHSHSERHGIEFSQSARVDAAKACPFCGTDTILYTWDDDGENIQLMCSACHALGPPGNTLSSALPKWNRRVWRERLRT